LPLKERHHGLAHLWIEAIDQARHKQGDVPLLMVVQG
jgi:hypothetical protein